MTKIEEYVETGIHPDIEDVMTKELISIYQKWKDCNMLTGRGDKILAFMNRIEDEKMKAFFILVKEELDGNEGKGFSEKELKEKIKDLFETWKKYAGIEFGIEFSDLEKEKEKEKEKPEVIFVANASAILNMELNRKK